MRRPSSTMPLADELLGQAADGLLDLLLAAGELARLVGRAGQLGDGRGGGSSVAALRSALPAIVTALASRRRRRGSTASNTSWP